MAGRNYPKLEYVKFGQDLLGTFDLDPIYPMLAAADLDASTMKRWLLAYWCFYSAGVASRLAEIADSADYYHAMFKGLPSFPRGHERRHFRAAAAISAIETLRAFGSPEDVVDYMTDGADFQSISVRVQSFTGFGPWISWKIADMTERVLQREVSFRDTDMFMYKDPVKGAALLLKNDEAAKLSKEELEYVVTSSISAFRRYKAPPYLDRQLNIQEIETILCKWKSHMHGHYSLGNDSVDVAHGLQGWGDLASHLYECLKNCVSYEV